MTQHQCVFWEVTLPSLELDALWTVAEAAEHAKVSEATVRSWAHRGHLPVAARIDDRPRFRPLDVARAEFKTRRHAHRKVA